MAGYNAVSAKEQATHIPVTMRSWVTVLIASLFFFYEFIQWNMFNSISSSLMSAFHVDAAKLGELSSFYFSANVIFLLVAGPLLDRFSMRRIILSALGICVIGTALFSTAGSFDLACFYRFLTGIGSAFCFLSVIRLASRWFPTQRMGFVIGIILLIAMFGGWVAQTPLTLLAQSFHWRDAIKIDAAFGVFIWVLIALVIRDAPKGYEALKENDQQQIQAVGLLKSYRMAFGRLQNWCCGLYVFVMNLPVGVLGGLWGTLYLTTTHDISRVHAANVSSMLFIGAMIGSPLFGWFSDKIQLRRAPMMIGAVISLILISAVIFIPTFSYYELAALFLLIGIFSYAQTLAYPLVAENSKRFITAMSVSVVNISVQGGIGFSQPLFGYLMDKHMLQRVHEITTNYMPSDFTWAMWLFPIGFIIAILIVFALPETRCQQRAE